MANFSYYFGIYSNLCNKFINTCITLKVVSHCPVLLLWAICFLGDILLSQHTVTTESPVSDENVAEESDLQ